ncbi:MAG: hypothetical protein AAF995_08195 [Planctomycetota bacterium]
MLRSSLALVSLVLLVVAAPVLAAPEPDPVPTRWEFEFEADPLRIAIVDLPEVGPTPYFYLTYRVTNFWGGDLLFAPDAKLKTDEGELLVAGRNVPAAAVANVMARLNNPLLRDQFEIVGVVPEGPENARDGVAIWPATDLDVDEIRVFVAGLSGESRAYVVDRDGIDPQRFTLRKTRMLRFETPGIIGYRDNQRLEPAEARWIMR